jgi:Tol biopolymer transport system component
LRKFLLLLSSMTLAVLLVWGVGLVAVAKSAQAAFPGKNGKIAYEYHDILDWDLDDPVTAPSDIFVANPNGSGKVNLTKTAQRPDYDPAVAPYGKRVAFVGCPTYGCGIYTIGADGTNPTRIADGSSPSYQPRDPSWSPDGTRIAFGRPGEREGVAYNDIWVMRANGSGQRRVASGSSPAWSPGGGKIAFERDGDIWTMGVDGTGKKNLSGPFREDGFGGARSPSWSPDGKKLAFAAGVNRGGLGGCTYSNIFTMNAGGSPWTQLTRNEDFHDCASNNFPPYSREPAYSPDGLKIAFVHGVYQDNVVVMNRDGSGLVRPNFDPGEGEHGAVTASPDWGRVPPTP